MKICVLHTAQGASNSGNGEKSFKEDIDHIYSHNTFDVYLNCLSAGIRVPGNEPERFPKVVSLNDKASFETPYFDAVCYDNRSDIKSRDFSKQVATATLIVDEPRRSRLRETAQKAFEAVEMQGGSGLCEVHMRIDAATGEISVLEVNASPEIFYPHGSSPIDKVIELTYPGAHAALFDMLLATKSIQNKAYHQSHEIVCNFYRNYSKTYDNAWDLPVLEVIRHERATKYYKQPIHIKPIEEFIMTADTFDHVVCFLTRMFMIACRSVSFEIYDTPEKHIEAINTKIGTTALYNNAKHFERFLTPKGWKMVFKKEQFLFKSPNSGTDVYGTLYRYEKQE
ncbi:hypothetical protein LX32DRAFT_681006 [Colletotrichum zoysiae]|uniref:ATP-grasp domain-containing protein n=1 Tax=Colletotrichum zoysiae TaxID=1216348 RepID=A0AAD9HM94_9PEZI|nr:hypothetical protein LX32DRAFT_681006 [Colletotrichum zoysiae]